MKPDIKYYFCYFEVQDNRGNQLADSNGIINSLMNPNDIFDSAQDNIRSGVVKHGYDKDSFKIIIKQFNPL